MVFNSFSFLLFFAGVLALYYGPLRGRWRGQKLLLLVASYLFYAAWNPVFVVLLWLSTGVDWLVARNLARTDSDRTDSNKRRKALLGVSLSVNLGLLGFFKYANFALDNFVALMSSLGVVYQPPELDIFLPIGISFYTFQTLSYTLDIYWGRTEPSKSFLDYALYVTFFPQLVAGPIVRSTEFLPQCNEAPPVDVRRFTWGMILIVVGLFNKVVIADGLLAPIVDQTFAKQQAFGFLDAWVGTLSFAGQIYCDFAGYSICAIGAALCLGFALPDNFRHPYGALGFSEFWRKWHISLSQWLRDYVYIPLGGNRKGKRRTYINLMLTMLIGGLWHGAAWTFVLWGALHGGYLMLERFLKHQWGEVGFWHTSAGRAILVVATFALVCIAWVPFRATSFAQSLAMLEAMFGGGAAFDAGSHDVAIGLGVMAAMVGYHGYMRGRSLEDLAERAPWWAISVAVALMLFLMLTVHGDDRAFIYFQF